MKSRIDVNLELRLQEYTWQQPGKSNQESTRHQVRSALFEVREPVQTDIQADSAKGPLLN